MLKALNSTGQKGGLRGQETLGGVILDGEIWTPGGSPVRQVWGLLTEACGFSENGKLTAANKTKRSELAKDFDKEIKQVYKRK